MANKNWLSRTASFIKEKVSAYQFGYDAADQSKRRKRVSADSRSEDYILNSSQRAIVQADANDIARNSSIVAWAKRVHEMYVGEFRFNCRSGNDSVDEQVIEIISNRSLPYNCDSSKRHSLSALIKLIEGRRVTDGDVGVLRLADGSLQIIESDRIRTPTGVSGDWIQGVLVNKTGVALAYAIHSRNTNGGYTLERIVSAKNMHMLGYYTRNDQIRGVSLLTPALGCFRDVYESIEYAKAKAKVSQLFALAFYSERVDAIGEITNTGEEGTEKNKYNVDLGRGPLTLNLDPGDRAEFLESATPSTQFQDFQRMVLEAALKCLDLNFSAYAENYSHYSGSKAAQQSYERACQVKRKALQDLLNRLTIWWLQLAIQDGSLILPDSMTLKDVKFEWVAIGVPWWNPEKEVANAIQSIENGLVTPQQVAKRQDSDFYENIDQLAEAIAYARSKGVKLAFDAENASTTPAKQESKQQSFSLEDLEQVVESVMSRHSKRAA